ncbi:hypothetical protein L218DRAFT_743705 [Marasmius fiardii PR-910]|nr:hypothetical protein L218DRAFT_743705 [Marasmius fiardii PR-910]
MASDEITTHISFLPTLPPDIQFSSPILFSTSEFLSCFRVYVQAKWRYTDFAEFALESSSLHYSATDGEQHKHLYVTKLVPYYWQTLLGFEPDDLFQCSIVQEISRRDTVQKSTPENSPEIIYSVTYRFQPYITTLTQGSSVAEGEPAMVVSKRQIDDCPTVFNAPSVAEGFPLVRLADDTCPSQRLPDTLGLDPPLREYPLTIHPSQSMQFGHYDGQQQQQLYTLHPQVDVPAYFWRAHNTNCLDYQNLVPAPLISDTGVGNTGFASNCDDQYHQDPCEFVHQSSLQHQYGVGIRTAQINDHGPHEPHGRFHVPHTLPSYDNTRVHHQEWAAGAVAQPHCHCQTLENTIISL